MSAKKLYVRQEKTITFKDEKDDALAAKAKFICKDSTVQWICHDGSLDILFHNHDHPFTVEPSHQEIHENRIYGVRTGAAEKEYPYDLTFYDDHGSHVIDPKIILDSQANLVGELLRVLWVSAAVVSVGWFLFEIFSRDRNKES